MHQGNPSVAGSVGRELDGSVTGSGDAHYPCLSAAVEALEAATTDDPDAEVGRAAAAASA